MSMTRWFDRETICRLPRRHVALIAGFAVMFAAMIWGASRPPEQFQDFRIFFSIGRCWVQGGNPYDPAQLSDTHAAFFTSVTRERCYYPPQSLPMLAALGAAGPRVGAALVAGLNVAGVLTLLWCVRHQLRRPLGHAVAPVHGLRNHLILIPLALYPGTLGLIRYGQIGLPAMACIYGGWLLVSRGRPWIGGVLLGLATYKPQYALLPLLYLLLERQWRCLFTAAATTALLAAPAMISLGPITAVRDWLSCVAAYQELPYNQLGHHLVCGLPSLLAAAGVEMPAGLYVQVPAVAAAVALWLGRRRIAVDDMLGLLLSAQFTLGVGRYHDLLLLAPLWASLGLRSSRGRAWCLSLALGYLVLWLPTRLFILTDTTPWHHLKTVVILAGTLAVLAAALPAKSLAHTVREVND